MYCGTLVSLANKCSCTPALFSALSSWWLSFSWNCKSIWSLTKVHSGSILSILLARSRQDDTIVDWLTWIIPLLYSAFIDHETFFFHYPEPLSCKIIYMCWFISLFFHLAYRNNDYNHRCLFYHVFVSHWLRFSVLEFASISGKCFAKLLVILDFFYVPMCCAYASVNAAPQTW